MKRFVRNWRKFWNITKPYTSQGMVYLDSYGIPVNDITDKVKWLEEVTVYDYSEEDASIKMFKYFNDKYPQYKGKVSLF